jgi:hypothetical protein
MQSRDSLPQPRTHVGLQTQAPPNPSKQNESELSHPAAKRSPTKQSPTYTNK